MDEKELDVSSNYVVFEFNTDVTDAQFDEFVERLRKRGYVGIELVEDKDKHKFIAVVRRPDKEHSDG